METTTTQPAEVLRDDGLFQLKREAGVRGEAIIHLLWKQDRDPAIRLVQIFTADHRGPDCMSAGLMRGSNGLDVVSMHRNVLNVIYEVWTRRQIIAEQYVRRRIELALQKKSGESKC